jgi:hypothetical protein
MRATHRLYSDVGEALETFLRRHRRSTLHIATAFLSPNIDAAITALGLTGVRLLIGLDPNHPCVSPALFKGLERLRRNETVEVRCFHGLHAKLYVAPEKAVIVSSANFTRAGLEQLSEVAIESSDATVVAAANALFLEWWGSAIPLTNVTLEITAQQEVESGAAQTRLLSRYQSVFRAKGIARKPEVSERSTLEVLDRLAIDAPARDALIAFFAEYISTLPARENRWELTKTKYGLRINVGPLTGLQALQGQASMHVRPLSRPERKRLGGQVYVVPGFKSSGRFVQGALWVSVPIDRLAEHADILLPAAIAFASKVPYRSSWMYAHSAEALRIIERRSGRILPRPNADG